MTSSFLWGMVAASSLLIGGLLTFWLRIGNKMLGLIMAFGAGVLISAVAFELAHEAVTLSAGSGTAAWGLFTGAINIDVMQPFDAKVDKLDRAAKLCAAGRITG